MRQVGADLGGRLWCVGCQREGYLRGAPVLADSPRRTEPCESCGRPLCGVSAGHLRFEGSHEYFRLGAHTYRAPLEGEVIPVDFVFGTVRVREGREWLSAA